MYRVTGVRFHGVGKAYDFDTAGLPVKRGDAVIVETVQGIELGFTADDGKNLTEEQIRGTLKPILRIATEDDLARYEHNLKLEKEAYKICLEKIEEHRLEMNLVMAEYTFDGKKVIFYFTAEGRIDFRELVKDLAGIFRLRIELRQIGVRDEARMIGGVGICGREFCCSSFLTDFIPVSIRMAKEQGLSMNPAKISGCCGRLMCCLKYEQEAYASGRKGMPKQGAIIDTPEGRGKVTNVDVLRETVTVLLEDAPDGEKRVFTKADLGIRSIPRERRSDDAVDGRSAERGGRTGRPRKSSLRDELLPIAFEERVPATEKTSPEQLQTDADAREQSAEAPKRRTKRLGRPPRPGFVPHPLEPAPGTRKKKTAVAGRRRSSRSRTDRTKNTRQEGVEE